VGDEGWRGRREGREERKEDRKEQKLREGGHHLIQNFPFLSRDPSVDHVIEL
jgi:hypothetical protein